jgi:hypothetical protein
MMLRHRKLLAAYETVTILTRVRLAVVLVIACTATVHGQVLPKPEAAFSGKIGRTVKDSIPDFPKGVEAPKGAPNVLLIMTDDVGFGASGMAQTLPCAGGGGRSKISPG